MGDLIQLEAGKFVNKWKIEKKLGEGAFGAVYKCSADGKMFALKTEGKEEKVQLLKMEVYVLLELTKANVGRHFCKIEDKGQCDNFNYVVMTLVGKSIHDLRLEQRKKRFTMGCSISIGIQCLEALEDLHSIGYLHRDVKPGNYTVGRADLNELRKVYVLDFGMARKFAHEDGTMKKPRAAAGFRGTVRYAALSCHVQREMCRKDDVESWLYMLVEITRGKLPWRNLEDQDEVGVFKKNCRKEQNVKQLFGGCPRQYIDIMRLSDSWKFFDAPDYAKIYELMKEAIVATKSEEFPYDWEPEAIKKAEEKAKARKSAGKKGSSSSDSEKKKEDSKKKKVDKKENKEESDKKYSIKKSAEKVKPDGAAASPAMKDDKKDESDKRCSVKKASEKLKPGVAAAAPVMKDDKKDESDKRCSEKKGSVKKCSVKLKPSPAAVKDDDKKEKDESDKRCSQKKCSVKLKPNAAGSGAEKIKNPRRSTK